MKSLKIKALKRWCWYSFCSLHKKFNYRCNMCIAGSWGCTLHDGINAKISDCKCAGKPERSIPKDWEDAGWSSK